MPMPAVRSVGAYCPSGLTDSTRADEGAFESVATSTTVMGAKDDCGMLLRIAAP